MDRSVNSQRRIAFGVFEFDLDTLSLTQSKHPVGLPAQPARMLAILTSRAGHVVTRDELQRAVWGDRIVEYDQSINHCIRQIRTHLGDSADSPKYIETVTRRGYRFIAQVHDVTERRPTQRTAKWRRSLAPLLVGLFLLMTSFGWFVSKRPPASSNGPTSSPTLAVLPLETRVDDLRFADGVTRILQGHISKRFAGNTTMPTAALSREQTGVNDDFFERTRGADYAVMGTVQRDRKGDPLTPVRMVVRLVRVVDNHEMLLSTFETKFDDMSEKAEELATMLVSRIAQENNVGQPMPTLSVAMETQPAYASYKLANEHFRRNLELIHLQEAAALYDSAVAFDSTFPQAWAGLGVARASLSWTFGLTYQIALAEHAVQQAARLAPDRFETFVAKGYLDYYGKRDYESALRNLEHARILDPLSPDVLLPLGYVLRRQGKMLDAAAIFEQAFQLDPQRFETAYAAAMTFQWLRQYDAAQRFWTWSASLDPGSIWPILGGAWLALLRDGDTHGALQILKDGAKRTRRVDVLRYDPVMARVIAQHIPQTSDLDLIDLKQAPMNLSKAIIAEAGRDPKATAAFESVVATLAAEGPEQETTQHELLGWRHVKLGMAYAALGRTDTAIHHGVRATDLLPVATDAFQGAVWQIRLAEILADVGEHDRALDLLADVLAVPGPISVSSIVVDPIWRPLENHPRFKAITSMKP